MEQTLNILIVDESGECLPVIGSVLHQLGCHTVIAKNVREAAGALLGREFVAVLANVRAEGSFGLSAELRKHKKSAVTPLIYFGVNAGDTLGYSNGAIDCLPVDVSPEAVRAKLSGFVEIFRKTRRISAEAEHRIKAVREQATRAEAESAQLRFSFLAEASRRLANSIDYSETLDTLASAAVPFLAECCLVSVPPSEGFRRPMVHTRAVPEITQRLRDKHARENQVLHDCMQEIIDAAQNTGETQCAAQVDAGTIHAITQRPELRMLLETIGLSAYVAVPFVVRGEVFGVACYLRAKPYHFFSEVDFRLAEELTRRSAQAIDHARLYSVAKEARREAERANRTKDQFLAMLTHELRTPLTPVLNSVTDLESDDRFDSEQRSALEMIRRNVELEARIIDDLLDLTRISNGDAELKLQTADAHQLIRRTLDTLADEISARDLDVLLELEATHSQFPGDPARLERLFCSLIQNAIKFSPSKGLVEISTSNPSGQEFAFEVRDNGIGIEPALLPRIFNAFERGHSTRMGGMGIGLAISKAIVGMHGGTIAAYSGGLGEGATFRVTLPVRGHSAPVKSRPQNDQVHSEVVGCRILLVEDHDDSKRSLQRLLQRRGYDVRVASDIASALDVAQNQPFDVLISDIGLPDGTGMDLVRLLREDNPGLVALAVSGFGMEEDIRRSKAEGFSGHLTKPVNIRELEEEITRALASRLSIA